MFRAVRARTYAPQYNNAERIALGSRASQGAPGQARAHPPRAAGAQKDRRAHTPRKTRRREALRFCLGAPGPCRRRGRARAGQRAPGHASAPPGHSQCTPGRASAPSVLSQSPTRVLRGARSGRCLGAAWAPLGAPSAQRERAWRAPLFSASRTGLARVTPANNNDAQSQQHQHCRRRQRRRSRTRRRPRRRRGRRPRQPPRRPWRPPHPTRPLRQGRPRAPQPLLALRPGSRPLLRTLRDTACALVALKADSHAAAALYVGCAYLDRCFLFSLDLGSSKATPTMSPRPSRSSPPTPRPSSTQPSRSPTLAPRARSRRPLGHRRRHRDLGTGWRSPGAAPLASHGAPCAPLR